MHIRGPMITIVVRMNLSSIGAAGVPKGLVLAKKRLNGNTPDKEEGPFLQRWSNIKTEKIDAPCLATSLNTLPCPIATATKFPNADSATKTGKTLVPA